MPTLGDPKKCVVAFVGDEQFHGVFETLDSFMEYRKTLSEKNQKKLNYKVVSVNRPLV